MHGKEHTMHPSPLYYKSENKKNLILSVTEKMQTITKFELLTNEILIECFEYLNGQDIFYSFHFLNYRFEKLIHSIPLSINFEQLRKSKFDNFCTRILLS